MDRSVVSIYGPILSFWALVKKSESQRKQKNFIALLINSVILILEPNEKESSHWNSSVIR